MTFQKNAKFRSTGNNLAPPGVAKCFPPCYPSATDRLQIVVRKQQVLYV